MSPGGLSLLGFNPVNQYNQSDLLVLGLRRHSLLLSRMWNHTTYDLVQQLSCSILRVH
jgi:hypothetical protein